MMSVQSPASARPFSAEAVRADFPILQTEVRGTPLVYLDNAATTQKPSAVIKAITNYYETSNANIHRAVHYLSEKAAAMHDGARETIRQFINAVSVEEVLFVRGTTEGINLVASSLGQSFRPGDEIVISAMEHHSNIVPWQLLAERTGAVLQVIPMNHKGELLLDEAEKLITSKTRIVALVHVSNALGTVNPVKDVIRLARAQGALVLLDAAQSIAHLPVDVQALDCDFLVFSGHKVYGPTGIGVVYGKKALLDEMPPYQGGGDMIRTVNFEKSTWNTLPYKFEAGTPDIAGAIALGVALEYLNQFDMANIQQHEHELLVYATEQLMAMPKVEIIGNAASKAGAISFVVDGVHPHDLGTFLDHEGVAIRTGHHCAQPIMDFYNVPATARVSFGLYNTRTDVDRFIAALDKTIRVFG